MQIEQKLQNGHWDYALLSLTLFKLYVEMENMEVWSSYYYLFFRIIMYQTCLLTTHYNKCYIVKTDLVLGMTGYNSYRRPYYRGFR